MTTYIFTTNKVASKEQEVRALNLYVKGQTQSFIQFRLTLHNFNKTISEKHKKRVK